MTDYSPFRGRRAGPARLDLVEVAWRMRAPSGRILECGIYLTDAGYEARVGYTVDNPYATQYALTLDLARQNAEMFREAAAANPKFMAIQESIDPLAGGSR